MEYFPGHDPVHRFWRVCIVNIHDSFRQGDISDQRGYVDGGHVICLKKIYNVVDIHGVAHFNIRREREDHGDQPDGIFAGIINEQFQIIFMVR